MINIAFSGGAVGSDLYWSEAAEKVGHQVCAYSFEGHVYKGLTKWRLILTDYDLSLGAKSLQLAAVKLRREGALTTNRYIKKLLLRNWHQIKNSERLYAIGFINQSTGHVEGGTGWAVQMFKDKLGQIQGELYVYCQNEKVWYRWISYTQQWQYLNQPPTPCGLYTAIGTRKLDQWGKRAIDQLYGRI